MGKHTYRERTSSKHRLDTSTSWKPWAVRILIVLLVFALAAGAVWAGKQLWTIWNTPEVLQDPKADVAQFELGQTALSETGVSILVRNATPTDSQLCAEVEVSNGTESGFELGSENFLLATPAPDSHFVTASGSLTAGELAPGETRSGNVCWENLDITQGKWFVHYVHDLAAARTDGKWLVEL